MPTEGAEILSGDYITANINLAAEVPYTCAWNIFNFA